MSDSERQSGHGSGPVTIGPVTVNGRWRFRYTGAALPAKGDPGADDFRFIVSLTIADRKKLANLAKGGRARLTAGPFQELPVRLYDLDYDDTNGRVFVTFIKDAG